MTPGHDVSSIRNEESQYLIEDMMDYDEQAQLVSQIAFNGERFSKNGGLIIKNQRHKNSNEEAALSTTANKEFVFKKPESTSLSCLKVLPQVIFFSMLLIVTIVCVVDFKLVITAFNKFIEWVKLHPY